MLESTITLSTPDGPMSAFRVEPDAGPTAPGLVLIQEAFGVNDHIRDVARRFAREGYVVLAPEIFHRTAPGQTFGYDEFITAAKPHMAVVTNEQLTSDLQLAIDALRGQSPKVGIVGFCVGGLATFIAACRTDVDASVSFYGGGLVHARPGFKLQPPLEEADAIKAPILCFFGDQDPGIPMEHVEAVRAKLDTLAVPHEVVIYPGATHGFFCDARDAYHPVAAAEAWKRTLAWFAKWLP